MVTNQPHPLDLRQQFPELHAQTHPEGVRSAAQPISQEITQEADHVSHIVENSLVLHPPVESQSVEIVFEPSQKIFDGIENFNAFNFLHALSGSHLGKLDADQLRAQTDGGEEAVKNFKGDKTSSKDYATALHQATIRGQNDGIEKYLESLGLKSPSTSSASAELVTRACAYALKALASGEKDEQLMQLVGKLLGENGQPSLIDKYHPTPSAVKVALTNARDQKSDSVSAGNSLLEKGIESINQPVKDPMPRIKLKIQFAFSNYWKNNIDLTNSKEFKDIKEKFDNLDKNFNADSLKELIDDERLPVEYKSELNRIYYEITTTFVPRAGETALNTLNRFKERPSQFNTKENYNVLTQIISKSAKEEAKQGNNEKLKEVLLEVMLLPGLSDENLAALGELYQSIKESSKPLQQEVKTPVDAPQRVVSLLTASLPNDITMNLTKLLNMLNDNSLSLTLEQRTELLHAILVRDIPLMSNMQNVANRAGLSSLAKLIVFFRNRDINQEYLLSQMPYGQLFLFCTQFGSEKGKILTENEQLIVQVAIQVLGKNPQYKDNIVYLEKLFNGEAEARPRAVTAPTKPVATQLVSKQKDPVLKELERDFAYLLSGLSDGYVNTIRNHKENPVIIRQFLVDWSGNSGNARVFLRLLDKWDEIQAFKKSPGITTHAHNFLVGNTLYTNRVALKEKDGFTFGEQTFSAGKKELVQLTRHSLVDSKEKMDQLIQYQIDQGKVSGNTIHIVQLVSSKETGDCATARKISDYRNNQKYKGYNVRTYFVEVTDGLLPKDVYQLKELELIPKDSNPTNAASLFTALKDKGSAAASISSTEMVRLEKVVASIVSAKISDEPEKAKILTKFSSSKRSLAARLTSINQSSKASLHWMKKKVGELVDKNLPKNFNIQTRSIRATTIL